MQNITLGKNLMFKCMPCLDYQSPPSTIFEHMVEDIPSSVAVVIGKIIVNSGNGDQNTENGNRKWKCLNLHTHVY